MMQKLIYGIINMLICKMHFKLFKAQLISITMHANLDFYMRY